MGMFGGLGDSILKAQDFHPLANVFNEQGAIFDPILQGYSGSADPALSGIISGGKTDFGPRTWDLARKFGLDDILGTANFFGHGIAAGFLANEGADAMGGMGDVGPGTPEGGNYVGDIPVDGEGGTSIYNNGSGPGGPGDISGGGGSEHLYGDASTDVPDQGGLQQANANQTPQWETDLGNSYEGAVGESAMPANVPASSSTGGGGALDTAKSLADWIEAHKTLTSLGIAGGTSALSLYGSKKSAQRNADLTKQMLDSQKARQAQMDNPPPYMAMTSGPGVSAPQRNFGETANFDPLALRNYGRGPEKRYFNAEGGRPTQGRVGAFDAMRLVHGEGGGQDDKIPAMLSAKEYVFDADAVAAAGDGNPDEGAKKLDELRRNLRAHKRSAPSSKIPPKARPLESYMRGR